jgi:hypothetical protein
MKEGMLKELNYIIDLSENESNVFINITEPESEFFFIYELYCVMFSLLFHFNFVTNLYHNILILCVFVCVTGYRLGPWRSYKHETGIIRTSMNPKEDIGREKFPQK